MSYALLIVDALLSADLFMALAVVSCCDIALSTHDAYLPGFAPRLDLLAPILASVSSYSIPDEGYYRLICRALTYVAGSCLESRVS